MGVLTASRSFWMIHARGATELAVEVGFERFVDDGLFHERHDHDRPAAAAELFVIVSVRQPLVSGMVAMDRQPDLLDVVNTLRAPCGFASRLNGGK